MDMALTMERMPEASNICNEHGPNMKSHHHVVGDNVYTINDQNGTVGNAPTTR